MIGASSTMFSTMDFAKVFEMMATEFHHWEIVAEGEHAPRKISAIFEIMAPSYDMSYSVHAPMSDINIASLNDRIREDSIMETLNATEFAAAIGATTVTFHPGLHPFPMPQLRDKSIEACKKSLKSLDRISQEYGTRLALENMPVFEPMLGRTVKEFKELIDDTNLMMCFDFGHANTNGQVAEFIKTFKDRIVNIHIHDNHGVTDEHLTCGEGNIDFKKHLKNLKSYPGTYIIESKNFESAVKSKLYLEKMF